MYNNHQRVSDMVFSNIKEKATVRSLLSHVEGVIISKDEVSKELEIEWSLGQDTSVTRNHISKLGSVIYLG